MAEIPKVSVFIASYNHARFLPECLDSILAQTYQDFEIVVVDDGSTDESLELLMDYQKKNKDRISCHFHPDHVNRGISASCNLALSKTSGEYLAWIGSDDSWFPDKLEAQVRILEDHPQYGMVYCRAQYMDETGKLLPDFLGTDVTHDPNPLGYILQFCHPPAMTVVIRRECLDDVGIFDETIVNSDWDLIIRIFARWEVGFIDRPLAKYRLHSTNVSKGINPEIGLKRILAMYSAVREKGLNIGGTFLLPRNQAILSLQFAFHHFCDGNKEEAVRNLSKAFDEDRSLGDDVQFLNNWLNNWKPAFYNTTQNHFGFWAIAHFPSQLTWSVRNQLIEQQLNHPDTRKFFIQRGIERDSTLDKMIIGPELFSDCPDEIPISQKWKNQVFRNLFPELLFRSFKKGDFSKTRYYWVKTSWYDPSWLKNPGIWSIGLKAFLKPEKSS